jgi:hypothetical protein
MPANYTQKGDSLDRRTKNVKRFWYSSTPHVLIMTTRPGSIEIRNANAPPDDLLRLHLLLLPPSLLSCCHLTSLPLRVAPHPVPSWPGHLGCPPFVSARADTLSRRPNPPASPPLPTSICDRDSARGGVSEFPRRDPVFFPPVVS